MLTEEDKYMLIHNYLNGGLSGSSLTDFESQMKRDRSFFDEVEMHRMANQAVTDFYLLQVKDSVSKVMKQKAKQSHWPKWGMGLGICALSVSLLYTFWPQDKNDAVEP